jgi:TolB-like protein
MNRLHPLPLIALIALIAWLAVATAGAQAQQPATAPALAPSVTVAILDFDSSLPGGAESGKQISETLTAMLAGQEGITIVERSAIAQVLKEQELNATGLVDPQQAVRIGKLVGARILVTGRVFAVDKSVFITAKIIGTETTLVDGMLVKGRAGGDLGDLTMELAEKLPARVRDVAPRLLPAPAGSDPLDALRQRLAGKQLPVVQIAVDERHVGQAQVPDPPVDAELRRLLTQCGFTVIDTAEVDPGKAGVQVVIKGEAISEFAARIGNLVSCTARAEITLVDRQTGKTLLADRATTRAADLSENIAAKTALQQAGHEMALKILTHYADNAPPKQ